MLIRCFAYKKFTLNNGDMFQSNPTLYFKQKKTFTYTIQNINGIKTKEKLDSE